MKSVSDAIDELSAETGWNSHTKLELLLEFLDFHISIVLRENCIQFLKDKSKEDEEGCDSG